ncbi:MAG: hypothetical protein ACLPKT_19385 [Methylocella sp.]
MMDRRSPSDQGTPRKTTTTEEAARVWQRLGDFKPCWSDVPFPNYVYDQQQAQAIALGDLALLDTYLRQNGKTLSHLRGILEFGSGLTRGSDWLANHGGQLTIADICLRHLLLTKERLKRCMPINVHLVHLTNYWNNAALPAVDLLYSIISLQDDTPNIVVPALGLCLSKVAIGGLALIRAPTHHKHYELMLPEERGIMELHAVPQWKIFELMENNGFTLIAVQEERRYGTQNIVFHTFFAHRRR